MKNQLETPLKKYDVLLQFDNGTEEVKVIEADSANSARWIGKKVNGVYRSTTLNRTK